MSVVASVLIEPKIIETVQTIQYESSLITTIIDKFTATNFTGFPVTISVNLIPFGEAASNSNLIVKLKTIPAGGTYIFPEVVGHILNPGDMISTVAGATTSINIRVSGRKITQ